MKLSAIVTTLSKSIQLLILKLSLSREFTTPRSINECERADRRCGIHIAELEESRNINFPFQYCQFMGLLLVNA